MTSESEIIARLRRIATDPAARGLLDDAAVFEGLVITHDSIAEGVHFLPFDPPASVAWKLVAVNLSDLAAKGAAPAAALLSLTLSGDGDWEAEFIGGIEVCLRHLRPSADRRRHDCASGRSAASPRADRDRARRGQGSRSRWRQARRRPVAGRLFRRCGRGPRAIARGQECVRTAGRCLPPAGPAARRRAGAGSPCARDDGRVRRPVARRAADGRSERLQRSHRSRLSALVGHVQGSARRRSGRAAVRCHGGRRLRVARRASGRFLNTLFTFGDDNHQARETRRWRWFPSTGQRRETRHIAGEIGP